MYTYIRTYELVRPVAVVLPLLAAAAGGDLQLRRGWFSSDNVLCLWMDPSLVYIRMLYLSYISVNV